MENENNIGKEIYDPTEILDKSKTSDKLLEFCGEAYRRGILRFTDFYDEALLERAYFKFLVTIHELGHAFVAKGLGWTVLSFENTPGPGYAGRVIVKPPTGIIFYEYLMGLAVIAAAGQEAIGDKMGAGSDDAKVDFISRKIKAPKSHIHSRSRARIPGESVLRNEAYSMLRMAA